MQHVILFTLKELSIEVLPSYIRDGIFKNYEPSFYKGKN